MRLPRIIIGATYLRLWQQERRTNTRLRAELQRWQDKVLVSRGMTPIHQPAEPPVAIERPPIGITEKRARAARERSGAPSSEEILAAAELASSRSN